jgi:hypothetical protein
MTWLRNVLLTGTLALTLGLAGTALGRHDAAAASCSRLVAINDPAACSKPAAPPPKPPSQGNSSKGSGSGNKAPNPGHSNPKITSRQPQTNSDKTSSFKSKGAGETSRFKSSNKVLTAALQRQQPGKTSGASPATTSIPKTSVSAPGKGRSSSTHPNHILAASVGSQQLFAHSNHILAASLSSQQRHKASGAPPAGGTAPSRKGDQTSQQKNVCQQFAVILTGCGPLNSTFVPNSFGTTSTRGSRNPNVLINNPVFGSTTTLVQGSTSLTDQPGRTRSPRNLLASSPSEGTGGAADGQGASSNDQRLGDAIAQGLQGLEDPLKSADNPVAKDPQSELINRARNMDMTRPGTNWGRNYSARRFLDGSNQENIVTARSRGDGVPNPPKYEPGTRNPIKNPDGTPVMRPANSHAEQVIQRTTTRLTPTDDPATTERRMCSACADVTRLNAPDVQHFVEDWPTKTRRLTGPPDDLPDTHKAEVTRSLQAVHADYEARFDPASRTTVDSSGKTTFQALDGSTWRLEYDGATDPTAKGDWQHVKRWVRIS